MLEVLSVLLKMSQTLLKIGSFAGVSLAPLAFAELEGEFHFFSQSLRAYEEAEETKIRNSAERIPVVVTVVDVDGKPVKGAAVALMRLGYGGFTEDDVQGPANPRTDESGIAVIHYPAYTTIHFPINLPEVYFNLIGAITAVHPDLGTGSVELGDRYKEPLKMFDAPMTPWVTIRIGSQPKGTDVAQGVAPDSAIRPESEAEGGDDPSPESKAVSR